MSWKKMTLMASVALAGLSAGQAYGYSFLQAPSGEALRWRYMPITYQIGTLSPDLSEDAQIEAIHRAFETWEGVEGAGLLFLYEGRAATSTAANDGVNVVYFQATGWDPNSRAIATTHSFAYETGELYGFDLPLNDAGYTFTTIDDPELALTDLQNTVTHEVGHILGLDHSQEADATMYTSTGLGDLTKRDLSEDDVVGLQALYRGADLVYADEDGDAGCGCSQDPQGGGAGALSGLFALGLVVGLRRRREG